MKSIVIKHARLSGRRVGLNASKRQITITQTVGKIDDSHSLEFEECPLCDDTPCADVGRYMTQAQALEQANRCLMCEDAPCASACPAKTQPNKFLRQLRFDNPLGAAETILDNNPLGGVCGQVCPVSELCEGACVRKDIDGPVKIGHVQKFLHGYGIKHGLQLPPVPAVKTGHKVAVVGSGPAGLACARELARKGSDVTIFESRSSGGGALRHALSPFRVSHSLVNEEVDRVKQMGVTFSYNTVVHNIKELQANGFHDVFISSGLQRGKALPQFPVCATGACLTALSFLEHANKEHDSTNLAMQLSAGQSVTVIGGGSVAMDCAVTAIGLGAKEAYVVAIERESEFPADCEEVALAKRLGVKFRDQSCLIDTQLDQGLVMIETKQDLGGCTTSAIQSTCVIMAVGQEADEVSQGLLQKLEKATTQDMSKLEFWPWATKETPLNEKPFGVFYGGDLVRKGGDIVVRAVADGKRAAASILPATRNERRKKISLETQYCGLTYENPFTLSSCMLTDNADFIARAYDMGWAGAYFNTLARHHVDSPLVSQRPLRDCMDDIYSLRSKYPQKITGVSIVGHSEEDWAYLAAAAEGAGAHLIEMNLACDSEHVERYTAAVKKAVAVPVTVKLIHKVSDNMSHALAAQRGGADGISAVGTLRKSLGMEKQAKDRIRFPSREEAGGGHSHTLDFLQSVQGVKELEAVSLSAMGGIYTWRHAAEYVASGASNLQVASAVAEYGPWVIEDMVDGLQRHLVHNGVSRVNELINAHIQLADSSGYNNVKEILAK